jgi:hypothetical protein
LDAARRANNGGAAHVATHGAANLRGDLVEALDESTREVHADDGRAHDAFLSALDPPQ